MFATHRFVDDVVLVGGINPNSLGPGETLTPVIDMLRFEKVVFILGTGIMNGTSTIDFVVKGSATSGGTYTAIPGTAITTIVKATGDNVQAVVEVRGETVQAAGSQFLKGSLTINNTSSLAGVIVLGLLPGYGPAWRLNPASVVQILSV